MDAAPTTSEPIAFMGLGRMGLPMAMNLAKKGVAVRAWNRTLRSWPDLPERLRIVSRADDAVAGARAVIFMTTDARAVAQCLFDQGLAQSMGTGNVVIDMSTSGPKAALQISQKLAALGIDFVDAPVSGGVKGAERATLTILVGATPAGFETVRPALQCMGVPHHLGGVGSGQAAKLANQLIVAGYIAAVAEGIQLAETLGIDALALVQALQGGFADSAILRQHGKRMAAREFAPGGTCALHLKDLRLIAEATGPDFDRFTSTGEALRRFQHLVDTGRGELDHSAYYLTYAHGPDRV